MNRWITGDIRRVKLLCIILQWGMGEYMTSRICQNPLNCTAQSVNPHVKYGSHLILIFYLFIYLVFLPFLRLLHRPKEVPRLGVKLELEPLAYTRATAMQDPNHVCNLHHSSLQCQILNPLSKVGIEPITSLVPSRIR